MPNNKKLNIAIVCDPITDCTAGSFVSAQRFAKLLKAKGHKIILLAARYPRHNGQPSEYYEKMKVYRFWSVLLPKTESQFRLAFPAKHQLVNIFRTEKIDILYNIVPTPATIVATQAAKKIGGIKIAFHSHTQPENVLLTLPKIIANPLMIKLFYRYLYWLYSQADAVIYPTEFAKKFFPRLSKKLKTAVISNGVDTGKFKPLPADKFFSKFKLKRGGQNILFVGRLHPEKSIDTLIKACPKIIKQFPQARLWIGGGGYLEDALRGLAKKLKAEKSIVFFGRLNVSDLVLAYNACDIFVLPSLAELEGMVVLEAMACGKPLVIADSSASASPYLVNNNGLLFKPRDAADLASKILRLLQDDNLRARYARASLTLSREYDINTSTDKLEALFYSLL